MAKKSRTENSIINLSTSIGTTLILTLLKFVCRTVFIQTLGKEYLGINGMFSDILTMLSLSELGLDTAINFKLYKPLAEGDQDRVRVLIKFYRYAYLVIGLVILMAGLVLVPFLPHLIKDYDSLLELGIKPVVVFLLFLAQSVTSYWFFAYKGAIIKADQQEFIISLAHFCASTIQNIFQIIALIIWKDFIVYTVLSIVFGVLSNIAIALVANKKYAYAFAKTKDNISFSEVKDLFKDLGALFVYRANGVVLKATDNLVLGAVIGATIVGIYSNYLLFYTTIKTILNKFYSAVKASMGNLFSKESVEKKYAFFEVMNYVTFLLYGTASVGIAVVADELLDVWIGKDYIIAQPFALLVAIELLFAGLKQNLQQIRMVSGAFRQMWVRPILSIIVNLVVSIVSVHFIGIYGVILGTIIADFTTNFMVDPRIIHSFSFGNYKPVSYYYIKNSLFFLLLATIGLLDFYICSHVLVGYGWFSVVFHVLLCVVSVPLGFIVVFRNRNECKYLMNLAKDILSRKRIIKRRGVT